MCHKNAATCIATENTQNSIPYSTRVTHYSNAGSHSDLFFSLAWQKISLATIGLTSVPLEIGKSSVETYV